MQLVIIIKEIIFYLKALFLINLTNPEFCLICLNLWFVSGLIDAKDSFTAALNKSQTSKLGWRVQLRLTILMLIREAGLLKCDLFNVGNLVVGESKVSYNVNDLTELGVILNHIFSYPLLTFK